ncbi:hypothetical protein [Tumidithrix helvetica]
MTKIVTIAQTYHMNPAIAITAVISDCAVRKFRKFGTGEFYL